MELDINIILEKYKRKCADLHEENIMLTTHNEMLIRQNAELAEKMARYEKPVEAMMESPKEKKGVK